MPHAAGAIAAPARDLQEAYQHYGKYRQNVAYCNLHK